MAPRRHQVVSRVSYRDNVNGMRPQCVGISISQHAFLNRSTFSVVTRSKRPVTQLSQQRVKGLYRSPRIRRQRQLMPLPDWTETLEAIVVQKTSGSGARLRSFGVVVSVAIAVTAVFALTHMLKNVDYNEVFAVVRRTNPGFIALALTLVAISYGSFTLYDLLALRTIGRKDVPYKIAALASFTSYPIAHGVGAVALVSPVIRYRIYSYHGLGAFDVANICFLTGLTFWLGNLTALGLSLSYEPGAISLMDQVPPRLNRLLAVALLLGVVAFLVWTWLSPRSI